MSFITVKDLPSKQVVPGFSAKFVHSANMTVAYWTITKGSSVPLHQHVHEMMVNVIEGKLQLSVGEETRVLEAGMVAVIPSQVPHTATAITDCFVIDMFYPVREDYAAL